MSISSHRKNEESLSSSRSSSSRGYRMLTGDMPDKPDESFNDQSFTKKKWKYNEYIDEKE